MQIDPAPFHAVPAMRPDPSDLTDPTWHSKDHAGKKSKFGRRIGA
jgi:hypothetical protein